VADLFNHSNVAATHYVIHKNIEKGIIPKSIQPFVKEYQIKKSKLDMTILGLEYEEEELTRIHNYKDSKTLFIEKNKVFVIIIKRRFS
jgi:hypothetical protein